MSKSELLQTQEKLHKQAEGILQEINLMEILKNVGQPEIVGSLALGLMVWEDIDIDVEIKSDFNMDKLLDTARTLLLNRHIKDIRIIDNTSTFEKNRPKSYYLGIHYQKEGQPKWKIDIRFLKQEDSYAKNYIKSISSKLTPDKIEAILKIKKAVYQHPGYGKSFSSVDIYKAVLEDEIKSPEEFKF